MIKEVNFDKNLEEANNCQNSLKIEFVSDEWDDKGNDIR
jgi:hypothetical protein